MPNDETAMRIGNEQEARRSSPLLGVGLLEVTALLCSGALTVAHLTAIPIWIASIAGTGAMPLAKVSAAASMEQAALVLGSLCAAAFGVRLSPRVGLITGALALVLGDGLCLSPSFAMLSAGAFAAGWGLGFLAIGMRIMSDLPNAMRIFALYNSVNAFVGLGEGALLPVALRPGGSSILFGILAALSFAAVVLFMVATPRLRHRPGPAAISPSDRGRAVGLSIIFLLHVFIWGVAWGMRNSSVILIGRSIGYSPKLIGFAVSAAAVCGGIAPMLAYRLGERFGPILPAIIAGVVYPLMWIGIGLDLPGWLWTSLFVLSYGIAIFSTPFTNAWIGRMDVTGRLLAINMAVVTAGSSLGTLIGPNVLSYLGPLPVLLAAAALGVTSAGFLAWSTRFPSSRTGEGATGPAQ